MSHLDLYHVSVIESVHHVVVVQRRVDVHLSVHLNRVGREVVEQRVLSDRVLDGLVVMLRLMNRRSRVPSVAVDGTATSATSGSGRALNLLKCMSCYHQVL